MLRNSVLGVLVVLAFTGVVYVGCSSSGDEGGDDGPKALSFDGETSVPATGGAAIAVDYGAGFSAVISSMLGALAIDDGAPSPSASTKFLSDEELPICDPPGTAILNGSLASETATLTLANCAGSPLSSTATNGRIVLTIDDWDLTPGPTSADYSATGTAELRGLTDAEDDFFTIDPDTVLTGGFAVEADIALSVPAWEVVSVDLTLGQETSDDIITVEESTRTLLFGCFEVIAGITVDPASIDPFEVQGVLSLDNQVYTLSSSDIDFGDLSSGTAVPTSGSLTLTSGGSGGCFPGVPAGDKSSATATFEGGGNVLINTVGSDGQCFECTATWENLLQTLSATVIPPCPSVSCGGTGGSGGSGPNSAPVINYVGWEYPPECTGFGDTTLTVTISASDRNDPTGESLTYSGTVDWCEQDINITGSSSPVQQTLDCFGGSLTTLSVTVKDPQGAEDTIGAMWESAICEERCEENSDHEGEEECPDPWPED